MGLIIDLTSEIRYGVVSVIIFLAVGAGLLWFVDEVKGAEFARTFKDDIAVGSTHTNSNTSKEGEEGIVGDDRSSSNE